jgi:hypothetical protein
MRKTIPFIVAALALGCQLAYAQPKAPQGATVVVSEPGKAVAVSVVEATATVVAINAATRTVTLKGPQRTLDIVCGDEVKNFAQIKVGDQVKIKYQEALSLELKKTKAKTDATVTEAAVRAEPGAKPAGAVGRQVTVLADVVGVDAKKSTITLKGPAGNTVVLNVRNPDQFKVVKKGDQVEAVYTEALAISVEAAPKAEPKKAAAKPEAKK